MDRLSKRERQERILARLGNDVAVRISILADGFQVTTETIRRDLDELAGRGLISRTYGGAARSLAAEPGVYLRSQAYMGERQRIAAVAATLAKPGDVLMIDAGSTTTVFAGELARLSYELTVLTNSLSVARALGGSEAIAVLLCPGELRLTEEGVFGPETLAFLERYHADAVFFGAGGFSAAQVTDADSSAAWIKRKMLSRAGRAYLLADRSKVGQRHFAVVCETSDLDGIIVDASPGDEFAAALSTLDVVLHFPPESEVGAAA